MKKNVRTVIEEQEEISPIQERIKLFYLNGYVSKEISVITGIPKKLIKAIAKGEYVPESNYCNRLIRQFDESIARLDIKPILEPSPEDEIDTEIQNDSLIKYRIDVRNVALYKGTDDKQMMVYIDGDLLLA